MKVAAVVGTLVIVTALAVVLVEHDVPMEPDDPSPITLDTTVYWK